MVAFAKDESAALDVIDFSFKEKIFIFAFSNYSHQEECCLNGFPVLEEYFFRIQRPYIAVVTFRQKLENPAVIEIVRDDLMKVFSERFDFLGGALR